MTNHFGIAVSQIIQNYQATFKTKHPIYPLDAVPYRPKADDEGYNQLLSPS